MTASDIVAWALMALAAGTAALLFLWPWLRDAEDARYVAAHPPVATPYQYDEPSPEPPITIDGCIVSGDGFMLDLRQVSLIALAAPDRRYMPEGGMFISLAGGDSRTLPLPTEQQDAFTRAWKGCRK